MVTAMLLLTFGALAVGPALACPHRQPPRRCRNDPRGRGYDHQAACPTSVYEVADGTAPAGSEVQVSAVLTAVAGSGGRAWLGVAEDDPAYAGWEYSGLEVDLPWHRHGPKLEAGEAVQVLGTVSRDASGSRLEASGLKVEGGRENVEPVELEDAELLSPADPAALDGVLVRVAHVSLAVETPTESTLTDGLTLGDAIIGELPTLYGLPTEFEWVTGIAETLGTGPRLLPRDIEDFHISD